MENSKIEWCDHTFSAWVGCTKVSPGCDHCYAEGWAKRTGQGPLWSGQRRRTTPMNWAHPPRWDRAAAQAARAAQAAGTPHVRPRVFCSSLSDAFDNQVPEDWRTDLWVLIAQTPHLDWLLLTKRPQNIAKMLPKDWRDGWPNVWIGTTAENQEEADRRIPILRSIPARVRFLSCEPLLSPLKIEGNLEGVHWVIVGGESGAGFRTMQPEWAWSIRDQCRQAGVRFFMKQMGGTRKSLMPPIPEDLMIREFP